jgi:hypothetical protein
VRRGVLLACMFANLIACASLAYAINKLKAEFEADWPSIMHVDTTRKIEV